MKRLPLIERTPISPIRIREHKMGYKPVLACSCGALLDTNHTTLTQNAAWAREHEVCIPVTQELQKTREKV